MKSPIKSNKRNLIIISGPSGVGKDTVVKKLLTKYPRIQKTVSVTTRSKRNNETDQIDYYFISKEQFNEHLQKGNLVEYEIYDGEYYGTLYSEIDRYADCIPLILVIDVRGRENVMMQYPMAKSIFIAPPSDKILRDRIMLRNENTPDEIEYRLAIAKDELRKSSMYDYLVINDNAELCADQIFDIIVNIENNM